MKKLTQDEFLKKANSVHDNYYDYSKTEYKGGHQKITVSCPKHGPFEQLALNHLSGCNCPKCSWEEQANKNRLTIDDFIKQARIIHGDKYDYSLVDYINNKTKIIIKCKTHGYFLQTPHNHLSGDNCPDCSLIQRAKTKTKTTDEFIKDANLIHNNYYNYTKTIYTTGRDKIIITCPVHGDFTQTANDHLSGGCRECGIDITKSKTTKSFETFVSEAKLLYGNIFNYFKETYTNSKTKMTFFCKIHKKFFEQTPGNHLQGVGCDSCTNEKNSISQRKSQEQFIIDAAKTHGKRYDYSLVKYTKSSDKIIIKCHEHGPFEQEANSHLSGYGCSECIEKIHGISNSEREWLATINIPDDKQHRNVKIILDDNSFVRVDGYEPETKTVYEFHGDFWHGNPIRFNPLDINPINKKLFGELYEETLTREQKLKNTGYNLISIWESEWKEQKKEGRF